MPAAQSSGHLAACCGAIGASLGAKLAVIHVVCATLLCAPVANVRAQLAKLFGKRAVARGRVSARAADRCAFNTTRRTGIDAFHANHVRKTIAARSGADVAAVDAGLGVLIQVMTHGETPLFSGLIESNGQCRRAVTDIIFPIKLPICALAYRYGSWLLQPARRLG